MTARAVVKQVSLALAVAAGCSAGLAVVFVPEGDRLPWYIGAGAGVAILIHAMADRKL